MSDLTHEEAYNQRLILGVTTTLLALCYTFYVLRILSRKLLDTALWSDDWFMLFALFVCSELSGLNYAGVAYGFGVHRQHMTASQYRTYLIILYVFMMSWALGTAAVKIGILLFYWRVFIGRDIRLRIVIVGAVVLASGTAMLFSFIFQCDLIPRFWHDTDDGHCFSQLPFYLSGGTINIATDILVLSLPIRAVWKLRTSISHRISLLFLFCLGGFVCITSIMRITAINRIDPSDFTYSNLASGLWSTVEVQLGFICANLPHTRPLMIRLYRCWQPQKGASDSSTRRRPTNRFGYHGNTQSQNLRNKAGFRTLGFQTKATAVAGHIVESHEVRGNGSDQELVALSTYDSDVELRSLESMGRVKVRTEILQDVERMESLRATQQERNWMNDVVSTKITAKSSVV